MKKAALVLGACVGLLNIAVGVYLSLPDHAVRLIADYSQAEDTRTVFAAYLEKMSANEIVAALEASFPQCHMEAHNLGKALLAKIGDVNVAIEACGYGCTGGCFHGVLMELFTSSGKDDHVHFEETAERIKTVCSSPPVTTYNQPGNCPHGVGHALAYLSNYDLEKALLYCALFEDKAIEYYCATGVFMEYHIEKGEPDIATRPLHYPCDRFTEFPAGCYRYKMQNLSKHFERSFLESECLKLNDRTQAGCFYGIGFAYSPLVFENPAFLSELCVKGTKRDRELCVEAISEEITEFDKDTAERACASLDENLETFCLQGVERRYYSIEKDWSGYF